MDFTGWTSSEEGEDRKGDGHSFLGCTRYNSYRLPFVKTNDQWRLLRSLIRPFQQHFKEKTSPFVEEESAVPSRQCTGSRPAPMAKFNEFHYELLPHPTYSPDLAHCDYFLFSNLKKWFREKRLTTREQLIAETEAYFEGLDKSYYSDDLKKLENRWIKCIELKGDILRIKMNRSKKMFYYGFLKTYWLTLV